MGKIYSATTTKAGFLIALCIDYSNFFCTVLAEHTDNGAPLIPTLVNDTVEHREVLVH
jgi:hypothetical protein